MRKIIYVVIFISFIYSYSQQTDKTYLPNITPPSPESYSFTEYGKNSVNEFAGKINLNIPVYNYKEAVS